MSSNESSLAARRREFAEIQRARHARLAEAQAAERDPNSPEFRAVQQQRLRTITGIVAFFAVALGACLPRFQWPPESALALVTQASTWLLFFVLSAYTVVVATEWRRLRSSASGAEPENVKAKES